jgi:thiol-disulfide isomerase/thioredoxin
MKSYSRLSGALALVLLIAVLGACSTGNQGVNSAPERTSSEAFSVSMLDGAGLFTPELSVVEDANGVTAVVSASAAENLSGAAFHLNYDASRYTPESVEFGGFLGDGDDVLTLALTNRADYVPVAIAQVGSAGISPAAGSGELAVVRFRNEPFNGRAFSSVPDGDANTVTDLTVVGQGAGTVDLHWTEINNGDYDNNGLVLASDLVPLGLFFGESVAASSDPERVAMADGNGNGLIELGDITPIGQNYEHRLSGYMVYTNAEGTSPVTTGLTMSRAAAQGQPENDDPSHPLGYTYTADLPAGDVQFTVRPVDDSDLGNPGPVSNAVEPVSDDEPPADPANLTAESGSTVGDRAVQLTWTPSTSLDVRDYVIEAQMDSLAGIWEPVATVGAAVSAYLHENEFFVEGETYTYRVHAIDYTDRVSGYATSAPVEPWFFFLPEPQNLTVNNQIPTAEAIEVNWDPPADDSDVFYYKVYDADTDTLLNTTMSKMVTTFTHTGLTPGTTYNYYAVSCNAVGLESSPSNTAGTTPSEITEINITSLTTDKTTHCTDGSEPAANLSVATDIAPTDVDWSCSLGDVTGTGQDVSWSVPGGAQPQVVTITCTVSIGAGQDSREIKLYLTEYGIETQVDGGSGDFFEIEAESLFVPNTPHAALSERFEGEGQAMIVSQWGLWCGYCKLEMPDFQEYVEWWGDDGFYATGIDHWDNRAAVEDWMTANSCQDVDTFFVDAGTAQAWFNHHNFSAEGSTFGSAPMNVIYDRDGKCRWVKSGSLTYQQASKDKCEKMLSELVGQPIP